MTQKQLIDQFCKYRGKCTTDDVVALTYAYKSLQLDFIDKACEWLKDFIEWNDLCTLEDIEQFRKAMKGGEG